MSSLPEFRPKIIDVAVIVDAPRILYHYGPNKARDHKGFSDYIPLGANSEGVGYVYMLSTWWDSRSEGGSELDILGKRGNIIRWRIQTLSLGGVADGVPADSTMAPAYLQGEADVESVAYRAFIRGFVFNQGAENLTPPKQVVETVNSWEIDVTTKNIVRKEITDVYWESTVLNEGEVVYHMPFNLFCNCEDCNDNSDGGDDGGGGGGGGGGDGCGGYQHDPFINKPA